MTRGPALVSELRVFFLNVRGVEQKNPGKLNGGRGGEYFPAKALPDQTGKVSDMVDVSVSENYRFNGGRLERRCCPILLTQYFGPLKNPTVNQEPASVNGN